MTNPTVGWLGRTFGWSGSREQWLTALGVCGWLAGLVAIAHYSQFWSVGLTLAITLGWFLLFAIVAHSAVRDLFGPVFFYDLVRVNRNRFTFVLRGFYVMCIGAFLALMYYAWILDYAYRDYTAAGQLALFGAAIFTGLTLAIYTGTRESWLFTIRLLVLLLGIAVVLLLFAVAIAQFAFATGAGQKGADLLPPSTVSKFATEFFTAFVVVQFIVMALLTPVYVAATIAVEKERKTLEFLLATDLRNREIVFGKLASRVLTLVMYVLAGLPLMAFLQLFGGIDPEQLLAATIATIMMILGLSALSIWVSVTLKKSRDAIAITYMLALAYGFLSFMAAGFSNFSPGGWWNAPVELIGYRLGLNDILAALADGNPAWAILKFTDTRLTGPVGISSKMMDILRDFVIFWSLAIALLLISAILKVRRVALNQAYGGFSRRTIVHPKALGAKKIRDVDTETRNPIILLVDGTRQRPPMGENPLTWKEVFVDSTFKSGLLGRALALLILILVFIWPGIIYWNTFVEPSSYRLGWSLSEKWFSFSEIINGWVRVCTGVIGFMMMMAACLRGAGAISGEKDRDTWVSLTSTPLSSEDMLWGKFWGCLFSLRRAFAVLVLIWAFGLATDSVRPITMPFVLMLTIIYVSAFALIGIYCSITARTTLIASVRAFFAGLFFAGGFWALIGLCCLLPLNLMRASYSMKEAIQSFFWGFTPPVMVGIAPLNGFRNQDLGPFEDNNLSGMLGAMMGTVCWLLLCLLMVSLCRAKLLQAMNRAPMRRGKPPDERRPQARRVNRETEEAT